MSYDFSKMGQIDLNQASMSASSYRVARTASTSKVLNKFWEELKLDANKQPILILGGEYESLIDTIKKPWKEYLLHKTPYVAGKQQKEIVCTSGPDRFNKRPCVGCVLFEHGPKKENPWYPKVTVKFNVLSLASYHDNVPYIKDGQAQKKDDGKPILIKQRCLGKACTNCAAHGKPTLIGRVMKMVLTGSHFNQLIAYNKNLRNLCAGCGKTIVLNDFACGNCNNILFDVNAGQGPVSEEFLKEFGSTPQSCPKCGNVGIPREGLDCGYDEEGLVKEVEDCPLEFPVRMSIFDTAILVSKQGEKTQSRLDFGEKKSLNEKSKIKYAHPSKMSVTEILNKAIEANGGKLFNLDEETKLLSPEEQAATLGVENPFANMQTTLPPNVATPPVPPMAGFPVSFRNM